MKFLLFFLPLLSLAAAREPLPPTSDFIRVERTKEATRLETANTTFVRGNESVTLIAAVHIGDAAYYEALNREFQNYDRLLYEMIGGEDKFALAKRIKNKENSGFLNLAYGSSAKFLELAQQTEVIDYTPKNFVHADVTFQEFQELQEKRNESLLGFVFKNSFGARPKTEPNMLKFMAGLITGNANRIKRELVISLGEADDLMNQLGGQSVIIDDRNAKCLAVLEREFKAGHTKCGIFYGGAHFPDMEAALYEMGFKKSQQDWVTAWNIPKN